jgi:membrane protease YdiL (CAAX protease family)
VTPETPEPGAAPPAGAAPKDPPPVPRSASSPPAIPTIPTISAQPDGSPMTLPTPSPTGPPPLPVDHASPPSAATAVPPGPSIAGALGLTALYVVFLIGLEIAVSVILAIARQPNSPGSLVTAAIHVTAFSGTMALLPVLARGAWPSLWRSALALSSWPAAVLLAVGAWMVALQIGVVTELAIPMPEFIRKIFEEVFSTADPVGSFFLLVVLPPIIEETLCRGLLLRAMLRRWSPAWSITASALVFGAIHLNPWQFFFATWLGIVYGWVYHHSRSLGLCIAMHALNNALSWSLMLAAPEVAGPQSTDTTGSPSPLLWLSLPAGLALVALGGWSLTRSSSPRPVSPPC